MEFGGATRERAMWRPSGSWATAGLRTGSARRLGERAAGVRSRGRDYALTETATDLVWPNGPYRYRPYFESLTGVTEVDSGAVGAEVMEALRLSSNQQGHRVVRPLNVPLLGSTGAGSAGVPRRRCNGRAKPLDRTRLLVHRVTVTRRTGAPSLESSASLRPSDRWRESRAATCSRPSTKTGVRWRGALEAILAYLRSFAAPAIRVRARGAER